MSNLDLPSLNLKPFPLGSVTTDSAKASAPFFPLAPSYILKGSYQVTSQPPLLRAEQSQLSQHLHVRGHQRAMITHALKTDPHILRGVASS